MSVFQNHKIFLQSNWTSYDIFSPCSCDFSASEITINNKYVLPFRISSFIWAIKGLEASLWVRCSLPSCRSGYGFFPSHPLHVPHPFATGLTPNWFAWLCSRLYLCSSLRSEASFITTSLVFQDSNWCTVGSNNVCGLRNAYSDLQWCVSSEYSLEVKFTWDSWFFLNLKFCVHNLEVQYIRQIHIYFCYKLYNRNVLTLHYFIFQIFFSNKYGLLVSLGIFNFQKQRC